MKITYMWLMASSPDYSRVTRHNGTGLIGTAATVENHGKHFQILVLIIKQQPVLVLHCAPLKLSIGCSGLSMSPM